MTPQPSVGPSCSALVGDGWQSPGSAGEVGHYRGGGLAQVGFLAPLVADDLHPFQDFGVEFQQFGQHR